MGSSPTRKTSAVTPENGWFILHCSCGKWWALQNAGHRNVIKNRHSHPVQRWEEFE